MTSYQSRGVVAPAIRTPAALHWVRVPPPGAPTAETGASLDWGVLGLTPPPADSHWRERRRERAQKDQHGLPLKRPKPDPESHVNLTDPDSRVVRDY